MSDCCVETTVVPPAPNLTTVQAGGGVTTVVPPAPLQTLLGAQQGVPGIQGPQGPVGPQGPPGALGSDAHYAHDQMVASAVWTVIHNLGKFPSVTVFDSAGDEVEGLVTMLSANALTIEFSAAFGGRAYCN